MALGLGGRAVNPERKGNVGEWGWVKDRKELSVEGGAVAPPPSLSPAWETWDELEASVAGSPFRGGFSSRLINYACPASSGWAGRDHERQQGWENQQWQPWLPETLPANQCHTS